MPLIIKTTAFFLWVSPIHQNQNHKHLIRHKNDNLQFKPPSISSQFLSPSFSTVSSTRIRATLSLNSTFNHQITDYDADICRLCEAGNLQNAMYLLCKSEETILDTKTYCDVLQLCAESKTLNHGKTVHNLIYSKGIEIDSVLGSKLVFMYVSCGDLREGRRVFDMIVKENVFLWNFMMNAHAKIGDYEESIHLFKIMQGTGVEPDSYTFSCIFKCFAAIGNVIEGEKIHGYVLKLGFGFHNTVANSMIAFYFKCGTIDNARKLFDSLPERDIITWNSMISGYIANGLPEKAFTVFKQMLASGVSIDLATMISIVVACANIGHLSLGKVVHAHAIKNEFDTKMKFSNTLLDMYSKCGDTDSAIRVFEIMDEKSVVSWTSMIAGYAREGKSDKAIELFFDMKRDGVKPDTYTVTTILHACASNTSLEKGKEVHSYITQNHMKSLHVSNALMDMYAKCGNLNESYSIFSKIPSKDIVSWNTMIGAYSKNNLPSESLDLFIKMQREFKPDNITMTCILPACASLSALNKGREIHSHILRNGLFTDQYVMNALIDMYVKCGVLLLAKTLFEMTDKKDLVTWTVMIAGYGMHGLGHEAISTFKKMTKNGINPDDVSFTSILYACSHSGLVDEGFKFFKIMVNECDIEPKLEHYACMVDLLSRAGKLSEAYNFIKKMHVKPDATIWGSLLCGCRIHHDVKLAEKVAEKVFELEPENTGYYILLANIYAEAEKWTEVKLLRERIGLRGLKKNPGCSWIEVKGKVFIFVAGDKANPEVKKIEFFLEKMRKEMKKSGFVAKLKYALVNGDDMEKENAVCGHSEKLAIGFGVLRLPAGKTIRVTKNLRVCGDCHEMAKFVSKNVGREIVLRDANRFHHFKDGVCSCRGYW